MFPAGGGMPRWPAPRTAQASAPRRHARRAGRSLPSGSLGEVGEIQIARERNDAGEGQAAPDAAAPQFDPVNGPVGPDRVARPEVVGGPPGGAGERRRNKGVAFAKRLERRQRLTPLRFVAFPRIFHARSIGRCGGAIQSVKALTPPPRCESGSRMTLGGWLPWGWSTAG